MLEFILDGYDEKLKKVGELPKSSYITFVT